jgi:hypothetical protein
MDDKTLQRSLSLSLLSDAELEQSIDNLQVLFDTKLNSKQIKLLRRYTLEEDPQKFYSQYGDLLVDSIQGIEEAIVYNSGFQSRVGGGSQIITRHFQDSSLRPLLEQMSFYDVSGKDSTPTEWCEEVALTDSEVFHSYVDSSYRTQQQLAKLKGRVVNLANLSAGSFYRKTKNLNEKSNTEAFLPGGNGYFYLTNLLREFIAETEAIQYSKNLQTGSRRIFIFVTLLPAERVSIFNVAYQALKAMNEQAKGMNLDLGPLAEINQRIREDLKNRALVYDVGISAHHTEKAGHSAMAYSLDGIEKTPLRGTEQRGMRQWTSTFIPFSVKNDSNLQYTDADKIMLFQQEMLKQIKAAESFIKDARNGQRGAVTLQYNDHATFAPVLEFLKNTFRNKTRKFPLFVDSNNGTPQRRGTGLSNILFIAREVNLPKTAAEIYEIFHEVPPAFAEPMYNNIYEYFLQFNNDTNK